MAFKKYGRFIKRNLRRGVKMVGRAIKRRYMRKGKGSPLRRIKYGQIARDLYRIKRSLNSERKYKDALWLNDTVGAVDFNTVGYLTHDVTGAVSAPAQGDDLNQRIGRQIKVTGIHINYQFLQQSAATQAQTIRMEMWKVYGDNETLDATLISKLYEASTLSTLVDMNSKRNADYMKIFKCLGRRYVKIGADNFSGINNYNNGVWNLRLEDKLNFVDDGATVATGQIFLLIMCKTGNKNTTNASSVSGNQFGAVNTGVQAQIFGRMWYSDT